MKKRMTIMVVCALLLMSFSAIFASTTANAATATLKRPNMNTVTRKGKGKTTIYWSKIYGASGYEIQYGLKADYSDAKKAYAAASSTSKAITGMSATSDTWMRMRAYKNTASGRVFSAWSANVKLIVWKGGWKYAKNSAIHSDPAVLYYTYAAKKKNVTVAVNAGHGCKGGSSKKTLCHPDGSAKVTGGSTGAGAKMATAINEGTSVRGMSEAAANLKIAKKLKAKLLASGYNVLMIRQDGNTQLDNIARTVMANQNANCHIAIHYDSTNSNKGAFYISVPNVSSYRNMEPVKSHWRQHQSLGSKLVNGLKAARVKIWGKGSLALDLTQTSYSTVPSVDIEVGDRKTSTSDAMMNKMANGLLRGVNAYFTKK